MQSTPTPADASAAPLHEYLSLRDVARLLGASYSAAYSLSVSGALGEPLIVGRSYYYRRDAAERATTRRREQWAAGGRNAPLVEESA